MWNNLAQSGRVGTANISGELAADKRVRMGLKGLVGRRAGRMKNGSWKIEKSPKKEKKRPTDVVIVRIPTTQKMRTNESRGSLEKVRYKGRSEDRC